MSYTKYMSIKKGFAFFTFFFVVCAFTFSHVSAANLKTGSFGGRVVTTAVPSVTCAAQYGPILITPASGSSAKPFVITATQKKVTPGGQILGLYDRKPDMKSCYLDTPFGPIPVPVYKIKAGKLNTSLY